MGGIFNLMYEEERRDAILLNSSRAKFLWLAKNIEPYFERYLDDILRIVHDMETVL